jgi:hypothetical protein
MALVIGVPFRRNPSARVPILGDWNGRLRQRGKHGANALAAGVSGSGTGGPLPITDTRTPITEFRLTLRITAVIVSGLQV